VGQRVKHVDDSFSQSKPLNQLSDHRGPILRLRLRFLSFQSVFRFFTGVLIQNFNKMVDRERLIGGLKRLDDILSTVRVTLRA